MKFINVQIFEDDYTALQDGFAVVTKMNCSKNVTFWNFTCTYKTDLDVAVNDLVVIPVHRANGDNEVRLAIVREILNDETTDDDFNFTIKEVLFKLTPGSAVTKILKKEQNRELMRRMEKRAQQLSKLEAMRKYAEIDPEMKSLMEQYQQNNKDLNDNLIENK